MKKLLIAIFLFFPTVGYPFPNEPDGFRGIKWETDLKFFLKKNPKAEKLSVEKKFYFYYPIQTEVLGDYYVIGGGTDYIGEKAKFPAKVAYVFFRGKFMGADILVRGKSNVDHLRVVAISRYGNPEHVGERRISRGGGKYFLQESTWQGNIATLDFKNLFDNQDAWAILEIRGEPIYTKCLKETLEFLKEAQKALKEITKGDTDKSF